LRAVFSLLAHECNEWLLTIEPRFIWAIIQIVAGKKPKADLQKLIKYIVCSLTPDGAWVFSVTDD